MTSLDRPVPILTRRRALALGAIAGGLTLTPRYAAAVMIDIQGGNFQPMPIAIPDFLGGNLRVARRENYGKLGDIRGSRHFMYWLICYQLAFRRGQQPEMKIWRSIGTQDDMLLAVEELLWGQQ